MKTFERILIKLILVQLIFLLFSQFFFHELNAFPELKEITRYEGVNDQNITEVLETFYNK